MELSHSVRDLLHLQSRIKEVFENLVIDSEKMKFVSSYTLYEDNNEAIVVATSPRMTLSSKHIAVNYHWFRQHVGKEFLIRDCGDINILKTPFVIGVELDLW